MLSVCTSSALSFTERIRWLMSSLGVSSTANAVRKSTDSCLTVSVLHSSALRARYASKALVTAIAVGEVSPSCWSEARSTSSSILTNPAGGFAATAASTYANVSGIAPGALPEVGEIAPSRAAPNVPVPPGACGAVGWSRTAYRSRRTAAVNRARCSSRVLTSSACAGSLALRHVTLTIPGALDAGGSSTALASAGAGASSGAVGVTRTS
mmetsp:Transcript_15819/g.40776  ORF Transcript_15819/g.40776 Transcript_15819/m.40776 type:complete len:210 (-) Transcript_15819:965-1594(-)